MKRKHKQLAIVLPGVLLLVIAVIGAFLYFGQSTDYSSTLKANWGFSLPADSHCQEIYSTDSGDSFLGDGIRYHVFTYKENAPVKAMFDWQTDENETSNNGANGSGNIDDGNNGNDNNHNDSNYGGRCSAKVEGWLDDIHVPSGERPDYASCVYWYQSQDDGSELIVLWDESRKKLYTAESFL